MPVKLKGSHSHCIIMNIDMNKGIRHVTRTTKPSFLVVATEQVHFTQNASPLLNMHVTLAKAQFLFELIAFVSSGQKNAVHPSHSDSVCVSVSLLSVNGSKSCAPATPIYLYVGNRYRDVQIEFL